MIRRRGIAAAAVVLAFHFAVPVPGTAQQLPDAGATKRELEKPAVQLPAEPPPGVQLEQPERPALQPGPAVRFTLSAFRITGTSAWAESELLPLVAEFVGRDVGFAELQEAAARITRFYREHGYPVARAYLPAQDIREGVVEIAVLEGLLGRIELQNESRVSDRQVDAHLSGIGSGTPVEDLKLERSLLLLADLDGAGAPRAALRPGAGVGETDLRLQLEHQNLLRGSIRYENFGNEFTGRDRLAAAVDVVSPLGQGDVLSFNGLKEFPGIDLAGIDYVLPVGGRGWRVYAGYSHLDYDLGHEFAPLDASGDADTWHGGASYPLFRGRRFNFRLNADIEYAELEDRIAAIATVTERNYLLFTGGFAGDFRDSLFGGGVTVYSIRWNVGELDIESAAAAALDDVTLRTDGRFQRWNFDALRLQRLADRLSLFLSFSAQKADGNLDSSQKVIIGGPLAVRAFAPGEASGDSGYVMTGELRYDFQLPSLPGTAQAAAFIDHGHATVSEDPFVPGDNHRNLSAVGASLNWQSAGDWFLSVMFAHRVFGADSRSDPGDDAKFWLEAVKSF